MSTLNVSVTNVRSLLDDPREQRPSVRQIFNSLLREYANFYNELSNSNIAWTIKEHSLTLSGGTDYLISGDAGKVLFVVADNNSAPYPVAFTDLQDASSYWWYYAPFAAARPEDYNYAEYPFQIAFYRKEGSLYVRLPYNYLSGETLTITTSTGDWAENIGAEESAVLSNYHHLPEIRAALNLAHNARWTDSDQPDAAHSGNLIQSLAIQEQRAYQQFVIAKRSITADDITYIQSSDDYF